MIKVIPLFSCFPFRRSGSICCHLATLLKSMYNRCHGINHNRHSHLYAKNSEMTFCNILMYVFFAVSISTLSTKLNAIDKWATLKKKLFNQNPLEKKLSIVKLSQETGLFLWYRPTRQAWDFLVGITTNEKVLSGTAKIIKTSFKPPPSAGKSFTVLRFWNYWPLWSGLCFSRVWYAMVTITPQRGPIYLLSFSRHLSNFRFVGGLDCKRWKLRAEHKRSASNEFDTDCEI